MLYFPAANVVGAIVPKDDPVMRFMTEYDPDHVEVAFYATLKEAHQTQTAVWGSSLDTAEWIFGPATWVCPD